MPTTWQSLCAGLTFSLNYEYVSGISENGATGSGVPFHPAYSSAQCNAHAPGHCGREQGYIDNEVNNITTYSDQAILPIVHDLIDCRSSSMFSLKKLEYPMQAITVE